MVALSALQFSFLNSQCLLDSVFINALLVDPSGTDFSYDTNGDQLINSNDEFVEICNSSSDTVDVSGWRIGDDDPPPFPDFVIPDSTFLAPGACLVMVSNYCPDMPVVCDNPEGVLSMNYQFSGFLGNSGDVVTLVDTLGSSCSVVYGSTVCSQIDLLEIPDFDINTCDDWGVDIDGCPLLAVGDSCEYEPVPLPLEFLTIDLLSTNANTVKIYWIALETDPFATYLIEWSSSLNKPFKTIGALDSYGNVGMPNEYEFEHLEPSNGFNYYRITQEELSGLKTTSAIVVAEIYSKLSGKVLPNLIYDLFYINGNSQEYSISVLDMSGRKMFSKFQVKNEERMNISDLDSGYYIINVTSVNGFFTQPIVKM